MMDYRVHDGPTVGKEVLVACTIECAVGTACTASVVPNGAALAGRIPLNTRTGHRRNVVWFRVWQRWQRHWILVRPPVSGLCTEEMNSTLPDG